MLLGWLVGGGSNRLDDRLLRIDGPDWLLWVVDERFLIALLAGACGVALGRRRYPLAVAVAICPLVAIAAAQGLKRAFGRELDGALAYPSGHVTALVVAVGMVALVAARRWAVVAAVALIAAGMYAVGTTYHYFTDTVGGLLLGSSVVALAAVLLDRCQPRCDLRHKRRLTWGHDRDA
ncbi:PA-phosphatase [Mycobacterium sp. WMMD1722]|uniref:PA-phosphatase n=1 Tax=Mycobacterium sp. WMMD1722 TaxID=3404117 RepID=UPI003BF57C11